MKVAFINPAPRSYIIERGHETTGAYPPLGILYIMAYLKKEGYESILIDQHATKIPTTEVLKQLKDYDPDVIGFNTLTDINMGLRATFIAKLVKEWNPNIKIVFGNCHATFNHDRILNKYSFVDVCVRGEGELTFHELIKSFESNKNLKDITGITYRENDVIKVNPERPLVKNLDELPFPDRKACGDINYCQNYGGVNADYGKFTTIQSSRGCTFDCTFCCQNKLSKRLWRPRSIPHIIKELQYLESEGYTNLYWVDDNFTNNPKRSIKLFREMEKNKLKFNWVCDQRVDLVNDILLREMKNAGCRTISFGIESGNQRILNYLNKRITLQTAIDATKKAKKSGIDFIMGTFVLGLPTETLGEIRRTLTFSRKLGIDYPQFHIFGAIPGTKIWDDLVKEGKINPDKYWENGVKTLDPPLNEVKKLIRKAYFKFFTRPKYILEQITRTLKSKHRLKILYSNRHILSSSRAVRTFIDFSINTWTHGDYP